MIRILIKIPICVKYNFSSIVHRTVSSDTSSRMCIVIYYIIFTRTVIWILPFSLSFSLFLFLFSLSFPPFLLNSPCFYYYNASLRSASLSCLLSRDRWRVAALRHGLVSLTEGHKSLSPPWVSPLVSRTALTRGSVTPPHRPFCITDCFLICD